MNDTCRPQVTVTYNPSFPPSNISYGRGVTPHHALKIQPAVVMSGDSLMLGIHFYIDRSSRNSSEIDIPNIGSIRLIDLMKGVDYLFSVKGAWANFPDLLTDEPLVERFANSQVAVDGVLHIRKATQNDHDDIVEGDKLGVIIELTLLDVCTCCIIPYTEACTIFDYTANVHR